MTALDEALENYIQDDNKQAEYYDLILNTDFYIPISDAETSNLNAKDSVTPVVFESEGKSYLMLFDSEERLSAWAKYPINFVILAGFKLAEISTPGLHWAVNIGSGYAKEFVPDEIGWLKEALAAG